MKNNYPLHHSSTDVERHPALTKKICEFCNFNNDKKLGKNCSSDDKYTIHLTKNKTMVIAIKNSEGLSIVESIKFNNCPFCKRKL